MKKVCVLLADGFEEIEGLTVVDLLRRAKIYVDTISIMDDYIVHGAHGINVQTEDLFDEVDFDEFDMVVLPGGMPGTLNLKNHDGVRYVVKQYAKEGRYVGAICAAPTILKSLGVLEGRRATCYPSVEDEMEDVVLTETAVVVDENIITSQGVGTAIDFGLKLIEILDGEEKAKEIALSLELFTTGSLDIFGHESTVDLDNRIVVFDIHSLGAQLKPTGLLVITDTILNRVTLNWKKGKRTHIFIDEFHVVFENEQSGIFFNSAWRQFRKRNGYPTAITQNVEYLLDSVQASTMLSNSEFVVMLNQAYSDRAKLSKLLNISDEQMSYVTNADAGCGLIKYGSALVPFINRFPRDTKLYQLMTTKPGEGVFGGNTSN